MMHRNTQANCSTFLLLRIDIGFRLRSMIRAVTLTEIVSWAPTMAFISHMLFMRLYLDVRTWMFVGHATLLFPHYQFTHESAILLSYPHFTLYALCLILTLLPHPSSFQLILDNALKAYKKHTKKDLLEHPLADRLQACNLPSSILTVVQEQVQELNESQGGNERLMKWLNPTVNVFHTFSGTLGEGVGLVGFRT